MVVLCVIAALAVLCTLTLPRFEWIAKPIASTTFVAAAFLHGVPQGAYAGWILAALILSWLGDVLLIPRNDRIFRLGILSFLTAHVAYGAAFAARGLSAGTAAGVLFALAVPGILLGRFFVRHAPEKLRGAVVAYIAVLSTMLALAAGTRGDLRIPIAALMFYLSDISVALHRFVRPSQFHRAWGLPLYFAAQLVFAATIGPVST